MKNSDGLSGVIVYVFLCASLYFCVPHLSHAAVDCSDACRYAAKPVFVTNAVKPNILILFSNDETNFRAGYGSKSPFSLPVYDDSVEYYGYFDPRKEYTYSNDWFSPAGYVDFTRNHHRTASGRWSGNFLNWLTMCHADFTRKAMTGGRRYIDGTDRTVIERGEIPNDPDAVSTHVWSRTIPEASYYTPFSGRQLFSNAGRTVFLDANANGKLDTGEDSYNVRVEVCVDGSAVRPEENCAYYEKEGVWKPEGLLQRFGDEAYFGLMSYSEGNPEQGGVIRVNMHDVRDEVDAAAGTFQSSDGIIGFINSFHTVGWDPIAEMFHEAIRYFKGIKQPSREYCKSVNDPDGGFQALCNQSGHDWIDPVVSWCQKNFIVIINDEYPSRDSDALPGSSWATGLANPDASIDVTDLTRKIGDLEAITGKPGYVGNVAGVPNHTNDCTNPVTIGNLGKVRGICPSEGDSQGAFYLGGLAYHAHTADLRDDYDGDQTVATYTIAFRATSSPSGYAAPAPPMSPLFLAAKYGGFYDLNSNKQPDAGEWEGDLELNCTPSVSWNCRWPRSYAHAEEGKDFENAMAGFLTDILKRVSSGTAASVVSSSEGGEGQLFQAYFEPSRTDGTNEVTWIGLLQSLWMDAEGNLREDTCQDGRLDPRVDKIVRVRFDTAAGATVVDKYSDANGNNIVDAEERESSETSRSSSANDSGELAQPLSSLKPVWEASKVLDQRDLSRNPRVIKTFVDRNLDGIVNIGEFIDFSKSYANEISPFLGVEPADVADLISYVHGVEVADWRNRTLGSQRFLLGDIVHSSPTSASRPMDNYDVIYGDRTYLAYYNKYKDRPTYVYAGANDGMLHAFYGGLFRPAATSQPAYIEAENGKTLGQEVWAYIPNNLLPHLRWLTCPDYPHLYYVDLKPRIADARIFSSEWTNADGAHPYGWGTILICGMGFGGAAVTITADFGTGRLVTDSFGSAYFAMDITDPQNPRLLWEKKFDKVGFTLSYPAVARIRKGTDKPADVAYTDQKWLLIFGNGPIDYNGNPGDENGYVYVVNLATGDLEATMRTPTLSPGAGEFMASAAVVDLDLSYDVDVAYIGSVIKDASDSYGGVMYRIATNTSGAGPEWDAGRWSLSALFDAGKPITAAPAVSLIEQKTWVYFGTGRFLGPDDKTTTDQQAFYGIQDPCSFQYDTCRSSVSAANLVDVTDFKVYETGYVTGAGLPEDAWWNDLLDMFENKEGFVLNLEQPPGGGPSERVLDKPSVIGGVVLFPSFLPDADVCAFSGNGRLCALYYKTGTAYKEDIIGVDPNDTRKPKHAVLQKVLSSATTGPGSPSRTAVRPTRGKGGKTVTQTSTGAVVNREFKPAQKMKSRFLYWKEVE